MLVSDLKRHDDQLRLVLFVALFLAHASHRAAKIDCGLRNARSMA